MDSISIHPGVKNGQRIHPLSHTSKPAKGKGGKLGAKRRRLNLRQIGCEATRKANSKVPIGAFKMPGSMNQHKR